MDHLDHPLKEFLHSLNETDWPNPVCPTCKRGTLPWVEPQLFESPASRRGRDHYDWDPTFVSGTSLFTTVCSNTQCAQTVLITGHWFVGNDENNRYSDEVEVRYVHPELDLLRVPQDAPTDVKDEVSGAAKVIWSVPGAAAGRLRAAVERVLDDQGVARTNPKGKRINTHGRIELFKLTNREAAAAMMAVKWLGNDGAHDDEIEGRSVLDGAVVLELVLRLIYDKTDAATMAKVKAINAAKGVA